VDLCGGLVGGGIAFGLPALICWTSAVLAARTIRDLPASRAVVADILLTGFQLLLIWAFLSIPAVLAALLGVYAVAWGDASPSSAGSAALVVFVCTTWFWFRPVARDEWERLAQ